MKYLLKDYNVLDTVLGRKDKSAALLCCVASEEPVIKLEGAQTVIANCEKNAVPGLGPREGQGR